MDAPGGGVSTTRTERRARQRMAARIAATVHYLSVWSGGVRTVYAEMRPNDVL